MHIALIAKAGHPDSGVGRYTIELERGLKQLGHQVTVVHPVIPLPGFLIGWLRHWPGLDLAAFLNNYPVWVRYPQADIYHFTGQNLATLLLLRRPPGKSIVTVHDLIPWLVKDDPQLSLYRHSFEELFDRLSNLGMKRADQLISVSSYSQGILTNKMNIHPGRISRVLNGI